jgi:3-hydroxybutyryl-CoA dehydratase
LLLETEAISDSGAAIDLGTVNAAREPVQAYLAAVGDELPIYNETGLAPPLYFAASALGLLLSRLALPSGAVHSLQEIGTVHPSSIGDELQVWVRVERPRERGGLKFISAAFDLLTADGRTALTSKSTVMVTGEAPTGGTQERTQPAGSAGSGAPSELPVVTRTITQERLNAYAQASGDDNPLHLDPEFAAGTQFGGIIAHGMLTLAFVGETMAAAHGRRWLEAGSLRVRFKGAAYVDDQVETWGGASKGARSQNGKSEHFVVGVRNSATGQELVAGTATIRPN